jgi:hypothetical protein
MSPGPPSPVRRVSALAATAMTAAIGALIVGEYELVGFTPYVAGMLFGLGVAEVELTVGRDARVPAAVAAAMLAAAGWVWAAWISSGQGVAPFPIGGWIGAVIAGAVGFGWVRWSGARGGSKRPAP